MPLFRVGLGARADVTTVVQVESDSPESAKATAIKAAKNGDVIWSYQGAETDDICVNGMTEVRS